MKKIIITLVLAVATVMNVCAMSKYRASREARFLTDKMAWELDLSYGQMEDVYEINYDYFRSLASVYDDNGWAYNIRNEELSFVLSPRQWARFIAIEYFYIPVRVYRHAWVFPVHNHYHSEHFYFDAPHAYSHYSGAHAHNRDFYRGRFDNYHKHEHQSGHMPDRSGSNHNVAPRPDNGNHNNHGNANRPSNGNHNNHGNANRPSNGNRNNHGNANQGSAPVRNTPNRGGNNTRTERNNNSQKSNSSARPTRSQNAQNAQSNGSRTVTSGRR